LLLVAIWSLAGFFMGGEDELGPIVPWLVVLGGGAADERLEVACRLFEQGHGRQGVVLTGRDARRMASDRAKLATRCGIPGTLVREWPNTSDSYEEIAAVADLLSREPGARAIVVSDSLHMPRLRYVRQRVGSSGGIYLRESHLGGRYDHDYLARVALFWFREPLAYVFYRLRY
jgi:uncharacterized SAM-binding protein YcdF (DUF218 family)